MTTPGAPALNLWWEACAVLLVGGLLAALAAALLAGRCRTSAWKQTVWRAAIVAMFGLLLIELSGAARVVAFVPLAARQSVDARSAVPATEERPMVQVPSEAIDTLGNRTASLATWDDLRGPAGARSIAEPEITFVPTDHVPLVWAGPLSPPEPAADAPAALTVAHRPRAWWPGVIWLIGALVVLGRGVFSLVALNTYRARWTPVSDPIVQQTVDALSARLGLRRRVRVLQCRRLTSPAAFGFWRPTVVVPVGFADRFSPRQHEAVLAHELAHLAAGDPLWQWLSLTACAVLWWHPAAWLARGELRAASEAAADEASLLLPDGPGLLADSLVALGRRLVRRERLGWLSLEGHFRSNLGRRVERLLSLGPRPWRRPRRAGALAAMVLLPVACVLVAVVSTAWARAEAPVSFRGGANMNVLSVSWRGSLAAALWAVLGASPAPAVADDNTEPKAAPSVAVELVMADREGEKKDADRREGERREGDRREGERREGERREGERRPDAPRDRERGEREGDRPRAEGPRDVPPPIREMMQHRRELEEQVAKIRGRLEELKPEQAGEAKELREHLERIMQEIHRINQRLEGERPRPEGPPREGVRPRPEGPPREGVRPRPEGPPREGPPGMREVQQLRHEVEQLRNEMRELREMIRRLAEREGERK